MSLAPAITSKPNGENGRVLVYAGVRNVCKMETNCKELEYIRDNVLTEQKFEAMNTKIGVSKIMGLLV